MGKAHFYAIAKIWCERVMKARELIDRYNQGFRDFSDIDLSRENLSGVGLQSIWLMPI
jgi:hypothetical protein